MGVLKRRDRLLVVRLTEEEYENLQAACSEKGGPSLSGFVRSELLSAIGAGPAAELREGISRVDEKLSDLQAAMQRITRMLRGMSSQRREDGPGHGRAESA